MSSRLQRKISACRRCRQAPSDGILKKGCINSSPGPEISQPGSGSRSIKLGAQGAEILAELRCICGCLERDELQTARNDALRRDMRIPRSRRKTYVETLLGKNRGGVGLHAAGARPDWRRGCRRV